MKFDEAWQEAKTKSPLLTSCFSGRSENKYGRHGLWFTETFLTFCLNWIWLNLIESKYLTSSTKFKVGGGGGVRVNSSSNMASLTSEALSLFRLFLGATPEQYLTNRGWSKYTYCPLPCFFTDRYSNNGGWWYSRARNKAFGSLVIVHNVIKIWGQWVQVWIS